MQSKQQTNQPQIIPLSKFNDYYDYPKVSTLRQLFFRDINNFKKDVIVFIGKRQYVNVEAFFEWTKKTNNAA